jgi:hypothetical protein
MKMFGKFDAGQWLFSFFILFILIFCFAACRGVKVTAAVETKITDSVDLKEIKSIEYGGIPREQVLIKIPVQAIAELPEGAGYSQREGRAGLDIRLRNDTIYVEAVCDSLQRRIAYYEMLLTQTRREEERYLRIEKKNGVQTAFKWCLIGLLTGFGITICLQKLLKKIKG